MPNKDIELKESKLLFEDAAITEWNEKKTMLSNLEYSAFMSDIERGIESPLVSLIRLPFPLFAEIYMNRFPNNPVKNDPAIGYKLYLLTSAELKEFMSHIRSEKKIHRISKQDLIIKLRTPLEDFYKTVTGYNQYLADIKFIYITKYIDLQEAERINSKNLDFFRAEGTNGYELTSKLALFNPMLKGILEDGIGFESGIRDQLEMQYSIRNYKKDILREFTPTLKRTVGEVRNKLGVMPAKTDDNTGFIKYTNKDFRNKDLSVLYLRYWYEVLSDQEKGILNSISRKYRLMYILYKYYNFTIEKTMRVLACDKSSALKGNLYFEGIQKKLLEDKKMEL